MAVSVALMIMTIIVGDIAPILLNAKMKHMGLFALVDSMTGMITAGMIAPIPALARRLLGEVTHIGIKLR